MNKALIFIPGIKGTKLYDANTVQNEVLWEDIRFNFDDFMRLEMTSISNGEYFEEDLSTLVKPLHIEPLAYSEFWRDLKPAYQYKYIFPYDWRLTNEQNGKLLAEFIALLERKSRAVGKGFTHFDFVTHSMGNMPLRYYIKEHGMSKIDKVVFVAPPFLGSLDSVSALVVGQGFFFNKDKIRLLARTLPALFELLPSFNHHAIDLEDSSAIDLWNPDNWQDNLNNTNTPEKKKETEKFLANLISAKKRIDELSTWKNQLSASDKARMRVLVSSEFDTLSSVLIERDPPEDFNPKNMILFNKSFAKEYGDGVVPVASSCCYWDEIDTYYLTKRFWNDDYKHPFMMKDERIQRIIHEFIHYQASAESYHIQVIGRSVHKVNGLETFPVPGSIFSYKVQRITNKQG